jgi:dUTP pyrophosphatase
MAFRRKIDLQLKRLSPDAVLPTYAHPGEDAAMDMVVTSVEYDEEHDAYVYGTGWACATDSLVAMLCHPRSSVYKQDFYLTNSVGIVDTKGYRGEIKAIFKHRDSLLVRLQRNAQVYYDTLPWYKKLGRNVLTKIMIELRDEFLKHPCDFAPYKPGERAFQFWLTPIYETEITEVDQLSETNRGTGGHGSTGV